MASRVWWRLARKLDSNQIYIMSDKIDKGASASVRLHSRRHTSSPIEEEDPQGEPLEIMAIQLPNGGLLVIHAMSLRNKYRKR